MTFAHQLRTERQRCGLIQSECCRILGISLRTLSAWEDGANVSKLSQVGALAVLRAIPSPVDTQASPTVVQPVETQP